MNRKMKNLFADARTIVASSVVCMLLFAVASCESSKEFSALKGTSWRLIGIVNSETGILREFEPNASDCAKCFTLTFKPLNRFGYTFDFFAYCTVNEIWGKYTADYKTGRIVVTKFGGTRVLAPGDAHLFYRALHFMQSFTLTENELRLYSLLSEDYRRFECTMRLSAVTYFLNENDDLLQCQSRTRKNRPFH